MLEINEVDREAIEEGIITKENTQNWESFDI